MPWHSLGVWGGGAGSFFVHLSLIKQMDQCTNLDSPENENKCKMQEWLGSVEKCLSFCYVRFVSVNTIYSISRPRKIDIFILN